MCTSSENENSKLPYILIDSNKNRDDLPAIHLNHPSDKSDNENSLPSSPNQLKLSNDELSNDELIQSNKIKSTKKQKSFFQLRKKQISIEPRLLIPKPNLIERSASELTRPASSCSSRQPTYSSKKYNQYDEPLTAPILNERIRKPRASIAFDFNILHYLTIGHYFSNSDKNLFNKNKDKNKAKFNDLNDKQSDLDSYGSVVSLIKKKETKKKKKKKKKNKNELNDELSDDNLKDNLKDNKNDHKNDKQSDKNVFFKQLNKKNNKKVFKIDQSNLSSSNLSLNNLSSSVERLSSKLKSSKNKIIKPKKDEQMLHDCGIVVVPSESIDSRTMMKWYSKQKSNNNTSNKSELKSTNQSNDQLNNFTTNLPPNPNSFSSLFKINLNKQYNHHHHLKNCHHQHEQNCNQSNNLKKQFIKNDNQQNQSTKSTSFLKNTIFRSQSLDTASSKNLKKNNQVSFFW